MRAFIVPLVAAPLGMIACGDDTPPSKPKPVSTNSGGQGGTAGSSTAGSGAAGGGTAGNGGVAGAGGEGGTRPLSVLLFSKTEGFRHASIPIAVDALTSFGEDRGWTVTHSEEASQFEVGALSAFDVVVLLLTSGNILSDSEQAALEAFVRGGGGWAGVHSASDTEYDWPWYGELVGAYFAGHPAIQTADVRVERASHLASVGLMEESSQRNVPRTWLPLA